MYGLRSQSCNCDWIHALRVEFAEIWCEIMGLCALSIGACLTGKF